MSGATDPAAARQPDALLGDIELQRLTGRDRPGAQLAMLKRMGVSAARGPAGVITTWSAVNEWLRGKGAAAGDEVDWSNVN